MSEFHPDPVSFVADGAATPAVPRLRLRGITKRYGALLANDGIDLDIAPGQIHALLGENGAGKSTLMKIIYGAVRADAGQMWLDGQPFAAASCEAARSRGIAMVFQHFSLFESLSVAENVWLGLDPQRVALAEVAERMAALARDYGLDIEPHRPVHTLSIGQMQRVEIVRALLAEPKLLILDEPTSVLTPQAVEQLFVLLRKIAARGCSIVYISHKLHEIRALCDVCTVLRAGRVTGVCQPAQQTNETLARLMMGGADAPKVATSRASKAGRISLQINNLSLKRVDPFGIDLHDVCLSVAAGEVLGIAGVSGNGQQELLRVLSGEDARAPRGVVQALGQDVGAMGAAARRRLGLHFVPEERLGRAAVPAMGLAQNLLLTREEAVRAGALGWIDMGALRDKATAIIARFGVRAAGAQASAQSLSGGNLQKFIVGRAVDAQPAILIVAQPTWGVDVGAAAQIHAEILALRDAGCAVLLVSEEIDELLALSDRIHVIAHGRLSPALTRHEASAERIGQWMSGLWHEDVQAHLQSCSDAKQSDNVPDCGQEMAALQPRPKTPDRLLGDLPSDPSPDAPDMPENAAKEEPKP